MDKFSFGIGLTPDGTHAYVSNINDNSVSVINVRTNELIAIIKVGNFPTGIAIAPDGKTAYVVNSKDNTITPITIATNKPKSPIAIGTQVKEIITISNVTNLDKPEDFKLEKKKKKLKVCCFTKRHFYIEALPGYYYPIKRWLRDIYGNGGFNGQLDLGYFLFNKLAFFLKGGAYWDTGSSTVLKNKTKIVLGNFSFGLKYVLPISNIFHFYVGGGGRVFF